jgi:branched-chain amino acid transport system ATP-binding protein
MLLQTEGLEVRYGRNHAVKQISMAVDAGEIVTVLGANGAGKTSLLKAIMGAVSPSAGRVLLDGQDLAGCRAAQRVGRGIVLVPEGRQIFVNLTVHENLLLGAYTRQGKVGGEIDAIYTRFPNLAARRNMPAVVLSGGEQQMLAVGRALLSRPRIMMLDEPSLGLSPLLVEQLFEFLRELNRAGLAILLVEQNTSLALAVAQRGYVLELGRCVLSGPPEALAKEERLVSAYLGGGGAEAGAGTFR